MNIFIRSQDNDLFKYLSEADCVFLTAKAPTLQLKTGDFVYADNCEPDCVIVVLQGELELKKTDGECFGNVFPGEVACEISFLESTTTKYLLQAVKPTTIMKLPYPVLHDFVQQTPECAARIHAAINDSLCLKVVRLTYRSNNGKAK